MINSIIPKTIPKLERYFLLAIISDIFKFNILFCRLSTIIVTICYLYNQQIVFNLLNTKDKRRLNEKSDVRSFAAMLIVRSLRCQILIGIDIEVNK